MGLNEIVDAARRRPQHAAAWAIADVARAAGAVLRGLRKSARKRQSDLARGLGISQPRISQIESGKVDHLPPLDLMARYAAYCGDGIRLIAASEYDALVRDRDDQARRAADAEAKLEQHLAAVRVPDHVRGVRAGRSVVVGADPFRITLYPLREARFGGQKEKIIAALERVGVEHPETSVYIEEGSVTPEKDG